MNSRNGSQADGAGWGFSDPTPLKPTPNPVVTPMAGFECSLLLFLLLGRFSGLMLQFSAASSRFDPVVTSLAVDKNDGIVKTKISCPVFMTPRVSQRRLRTKALVSHAESPRGEQIAPPTIDSV